jgi:hypothetical protein
MHGDFRLKFLKLRQVQVEYVCFLAQQVFQIFSATSSRESFYVMWLLVGRCIMFILVFVGPTV